MVLNPTSTIFFIFSLCYNNSEVKTVTKRNKNNGKTIILLIIACFLIVSIGFVLVTALNAPKNDLTDLPDEPEVVLPNDGNQIKPDETEKNEQVQIDLVDYVVYDVDDIDFRFVIAKVRVKANDATNISLSHFTTSEGISLNDVSEYVFQLEKNNLYLGKQNVWFELISSSTNYLAKIFIPVKDSSLKTVSLSSDFENTFVMKFDLTNPAGVKEDLGYEAEDIISDGKTYQMKVAKAVKIQDNFTRTYEDGTTEEYMLSSTAEIHAFYVEAVSLWGDVVEIEEAWYQVEGSSDQFEAFSGQFTTKKYENIMNKQITDRQGGYIFFVTLNPENEPIEYHGTLQLKLKGSEQTIQIQVNLK